MPLGTCNVGIGFDGIRHTILYERIRKSKKGLMAALHPFGGLSTLSHVLKGHSRDAHFQLGTDGRHDGHVLHCSLLPLR